MVQCVKVYATSGEQERTHEFMRELLLGRWLRYAEKGKMCDDPNALSMVVERNNAHFEEQRDCICGERR